MTWLKRFIALVVLFGSSLLPTYGQETKWSADKISLFSSPFDFQFDYLKDHSYCSSYGLRLQLSSSKMVDPIFGLQITYLNINQNQFNFRDEIRTALFIGACRSFDIGKTQLNIGLPLGVYTNFYMALDNDETPGESNLSQYGVFLSPYLEFSWSISQALKLGIFSSYSSFLVLHNGISLNIML